MKATLKNIETKARANEPGYLTMSNDTPTFAELERLCTIIDEARKMCKDKKDRELLEFATDLFDPISWDTDSISLNEKAIKIPRFIVV